MQKSAPQATDIASLHVAPIAGWCLESHQTFRPV